MRAKIVFSGFFVSLLFFSSFASSQTIFAEVEFSLEFGSFGTGDGKFKAPSGLALDTGNDLLYVVDSDNDRIQIIDVDGNCDSNDDEYLANDICFVDEFGGSGNDEGEFESPTAIVLDTVNDLLYIADSGNDRIQIIDVDGNCGSDELANDICFVDEFGVTGNGEGEFDLPSGLAFHTDNDILYVADTDNNLIQIIDVDGNCSGSDELTDDVCFEEEFGELGNDDGEFDVPTYLVLDQADDLLYVADTDNNRIQLFDLEGSSSASDAPSRPTNLEAYPISKTSIFLSWDVADPDEKVTGYKIEGREGSDNYETLASNTGSNANSFVHGGLSSSETYTYRIYAINAEGTSSASSTASEKPEDSNAPAALTATAISPSKIKLNWFPPTNTFGQSISGYIIEREITTGVYDEVTDVGSSTTTYTVSNLQTDKTYTYVVKAKFSVGGRSWSRPCWSSRRPLLSASASTPSACSSPSLRRSSGWSPPSTPSGTCAP